MNTGALACMVLIGLVLQSGCAFLQPIEDRQRLATNEAYRREAEQQRQVELEKAKKAEADRVAYEAANPPLPPDEAALDEICDTSKYLSQFALQLDDEHQIAKGSGSLDLAASNELGFKVMNNLRLLKGQVADFKSKFGRAPALEQCNFNDLSESDQKRAMKVIRRFDSK